MPPPRKIVDFPSVLKTNLLAKSTISLSTLDHMNFQLKYLLTYFFFFFIIIKGNSQDSLQAEQVEVNHCISLYFNGGQKIIKDRESLNSYIRKDASKDRCVSLLKDLDMDAYSLLGINLNTGWCQVPKGLQFVATKIEAEQKYILTISYLSPIGTCRALSSYDLWIKVPALPDGYEVQFVVEPKGSAEY
jgi:hypothetical protein